MDFEKMAMIVGWALTIIGLLATALRNRKADSRSARDEDIRNNSTEHEQIRSYVHDVEGRLSSELTVQKTQMERIREEATTHAKEVDQRMDNLERDIDKRFGQVYRSQDQQTTKLTELTVNLKYFMKSQGLDYQETK